MHNSPQILAMEILRGELRRWQLGRSSQIFGWVNQPFLHATQVSAYPTHLGSRTGKENTGIPKGSECVLGALPTILCFLFARCIFNVAG